MMDDLDRSIDGRLAALAARAPVAAPPTLASRTRRRRLALSLPMVPALGLIAAATVTAGAVVLSTAHGYPGIENPGQPLAGARMECMSPPRAATFLAERGYIDVVWQVESGSGAKGSTTSVQQSTAPEHGYVIPGSILGDGRLHMVVDQRTGASAVGACFGMPMP